MSELIWRIIARICATRRVSFWLMWRSMATPYVHLEGYMRRWWLFNPYRGNLQGGYQPPRWPWLPSIRVHHITRADKEPHLHNHPWDARSIILRGWYMEEREGRHGLDMHMSGETVRLRPGDFHRITSVSTGGVVTLFITWRKQQSWGFKVDGKTVPWRDYLGKP